MARRSDHEHLKPEVFRLLSEGFKPAEIIDNFKRQGVKVPKSTVYDWAKEFRNVSGTGARVPVLIDPESPLQKIMNAMWDVHADPTKDGAQVRVNILNALLRAEQFRCQLESSNFDPAEMSDAELEKLANGG